MELNESIELIEGLPVAYLKPLKTLVISDLHLGYEGQMSSSGTLIPSRNLRSITDFIEKAVMKTRAENLIVTGDIKNDFSDLKYYEKKEISEFIEFCRSIDLKLTLIKGNHDNYLDRIKNSYDINVVKEAVTEGDFYIAHGDELPRSEAKFYIIGHEHPSIVIYRYTGAREKLKAFLYGSLFNGSKLLVLPASSIFATGTDINEVGKNELLSPYLTKLGDVDEMNAICISENEDLNFGKIKDLRNITV